MTALSFLFPILILVTYFVFIDMPKVKRQKKHLQFLSSLKPGMTIVTTCGLIGRIAEIKGAYVSLFIAKDVLIEVVKTEIYNEAYSKRLNEINIK